MSTLTVSLVLLLVAYFSGYAVTARVNVDISGHLEVFSSGFREVKIFLADLLYLEIDRYHHVFTYQGYDWKVIADYLPQLWLVTQLNPELAEAYTDGGYHLAVNLGYVDEGLELLRKGLDNCPDNPAVAWEYAYVSWEIDALSPREQSESIWNFLGLERRLDLRPTELDRYTDTMNANRLLWWTFEGYTERRNSARIAERYRNRVDIMLQIRLITRELMETQT